MPEFSVFWVVISGVLVLVSTSISILVGFGTIKQRKIETNVKSKTENDAEHAHFKNCLANDKINIDRLLRFEDGNKEFQNITLHCLKSMLTHFAVGNHVDEMTALGKKIDSYLIERR